MTTKLTITVFMSGANGDEEVELPSKMAVCTRCRGTGTHVNPSIDGNGLTREDFDEDPDFEEAYFSGMYDVPCEVCRGERVVAVLDRKRCTAAQIKAYEDEQDSLNEMYAIEAAERRMGC